MRGARGRRHERILAAIQSPRAVADRSRVRLVRGRDAVVQARACPLVRAGWLHARSEARARARSRHRTRGLRGDRAGGRMRALIGAADVDRGARSICAAQSPAFRAPPVALAAIVVSCAARFRGRAIGCVRARRRESADRARRRPADLAGAARRDQRRNARLAPARVRADGGAVPAGALRLVRSAPACGGFALNVAPLLLFGALSLLLTLVGLLTVLGRARSPSCPFWRPRAIAAGKTSTHRHAGALTRVPTISKPESSVAAGSTFTSATRAGRRTATSPRDHRFDLGLRPCDHRFDACRRAGSSPSRRAFAREPRRPKRSGSPRPGRGR